MKKLGSAVVADDNRISRIILREVLDQHAVTVYEAADGEQAYDLILAHSPDLVISDLLMPKIDGFGLATRIIEEEIDPRPKLFMVSAVYKTRQWRNEAHLTYQADEFLPKPVKPEDLEAALRRHFELSDEG